MTPNQELIEELQDRYNNLKKSGNLVGAMYTQDAIELVHQTLGKEKRVIVDAYNEGRYYKSLDVDRQWEDAEEYYNKTYNTKEK